MYLILVILFNMSIMRYAFDADQSAEGGSWDWLPGGYLRRFLRSTGENGQNRKGRKQNFPIVDKSRSVNVTLPTLVFLTL